MKTKRFVLAVTLLLLSAVLLTTASFAWFSLNTTVNASGFQIEAYSDALFLEIGQAQDGPYGPTTDLSSQQTAARRLVTLGRLTTGGVTVEATLISDDSRFDAAKLASGTHYYQRVQTDEQRNDTYEGDNYICIDSKLCEASSVEGYYNHSTGQIVFSVVADARVVYDGTVVYYKKTGNTYRIMREDAEDASCKIAMGDAAFGLYTVTFGEAEADGARYDGASLYYERAASGDLSPVGALSLGTPLKGYYTLTHSDPVAQASGTDKYYFQNGRGDYVCIGTPTAGTNLNDYLFWARAYSASMGEVQASNTMNVLKQDHLDNYYLHDTLYLRCAPDANPGQNLRVSEVVVEGNDSLTEALRVLFVATNGSGEVARATYDNRTGEITHMDGDVLFATILGDASEIVTVEVYIYFDGTDAAAVTQNVQLSGQTVSVAFDIDRPDYVP